MTNTLPQLADAVFLTDSGLETDLVFHHGYDLPSFAAFVLLDDDRGMETLRRYYRDHAAIARKAGVGFIFESPTWRASPDWGALLGYSPERLAELNRRAIDLLIDVRQEFEGDGRPQVVSGCLGPRGDGYRPAELMSPEEAQRYHATQIGTFAETPAEMIHAMTITYAAEGIGIARAAQEAGLPAVISFTVETDGTLPDGTSLTDTIAAVDEATGGSPAYYMVNCAHPTHFEHVLGTGTSRLRGVRANASTRSHAELDEAENLDDGDPPQLGEQYRQLRTRAPQLTVLGGCCGTDRRHIEAIAAACVTA